MKKVRRGYYEVIFEPITDNPKLEEYGKITESHLASLENDITSEPAFWIWSHKRWKREIPSDLIKLREEQYEKFKSKFRA
jgi:KDO2-lipid IV(A) lauroyltransferase